MAALLQRIAPGQPLAVEIETPLPLSSGFGLSGASSLAAAYAANALLDLGLSERALATPPTWPRWRTSPASAMSAPSTTAAAW